MSRLRELALLSAGLVCLGLGGCLSAPHAVARQVALADGAHLAVVSRGTGADTVVVIHGGPGLQMQYLVREWAPMVSGRTLIFYDQRGRGLSDSAADSTLSASADADDLESLRVALRLGRFSLAAHHSGASIAALYARRHPDRVNRMLLVSPGFARRSFVFWAATAVNDSTATARVTSAVLARQNLTDPVGFCQAYWGSWFSPVEVTDPAVVRRLAPGICDAPVDRLRAVEHLNDRMFRSAYRLSLKDSLASISTPTLIIEGGTDEAILASAQSWAAWIPGARELLLPPIQNPIFPWIGEEFSFFDSVGQFLSGGWPPDSHPVSAPTENVTAESPVN